jgi:hypothetical protein
MANAPSMESFSSINSWRKKSMSFINNQIGVRKSRFPNAGLGMHVGSREPASPRSIGEPIGHFSIIIPSEHAFSKVTGRHSLQYNTKEVGKIQLQMGMFLDIKYEPKPVNLTFILGYPHWTIQSFRLP